MIGLRRARSVIRLKLHREVVGGSRKLPGEVDESATGSTNFGPRQSRASASTRVTASARGAGICAPSASANACQACPGLCEWAWRPRRLRSRGRARRSARLPRPRQSPRSPARPGSAACRVGVAGRAQPVGDVHRLPDPREYRDVRLAAALDDRDRLAVGVVPDRTEEVGKTSFSVAPRRGARPARGRARCARRRTR